MKKYSNGKIYKIVCRTTGQVYYGSTNTTLNRRLNNHKSDYKCGRNLSSKLVLENNNFEIILVEDYPCDNRKELELREGFYIRNNDCVNKQITGRTQKQYDDDNKEKIKLRKKQYSIDNKERLNQRCKQYHIDNKERLKQRCKQLYHYQKSWGGDARFNNNLLKISTDLFL